MFCKVANGKQNWEVVKGKHADKIQSMMDDAFKNEARPTTREEKTKVRKHVEALEKKAKAQEKEAEKTLKAIQKEEAKEKATREKANKAFLKQLEEKFKKQINKTIKPTKKVMKAMKAK